RRRRGRRLRCATGRSHEAADAATGTRQGAAGPNPERPNRVTGDGTGILDGRARAGGTRRRDPPRDRRLLLCDVSSAGASGGRRPRATATRLDLLCTAPTGYGSDAPRLRP